MPATSDVTVAAVPEMQVRRNGRWRFTDAICELGSDGADKAIEGMLWPDEQIPKQAAEIMQKHPILQE